MPASLPVLSLKEQPRPNSNKNNTITNTATSTHRTNSDKNPEEEEEDHNVLVTPTTMNSAPPAMLAMQRSTILLSEQECVADMDAKEETSDSDANATAKTADATTDSIPCLLRSPRNNPPANVTMQRSAIKSVGVPNQPSGMRTTTAAAAPATSFSSLNEHRQHNNHEHENQNNKNSDNSNTNHCRSNSSSYESFDELINNSTTHGCDNDNETAGGMVGTNNANVNAVHDPDNVKDDSSLLLREQQPSVLPSANSLSSSSSSSNECNISNLMDSNNSNHHNQSNTNINANTNNDTAINDDGADDADENNEDHGRSNNNEDSDDPLRAPLLPSSTHTHTSTDADANDKDITLALCCYCGSTNKKTVSVNHNVLLNLVLSILYGISNSLWNGTAYLVYIKKLAHGSNKPVGAIEAVSGLASLLCALPIGYCADTYGRSIVIKVGSVVFLVTSLLQIGILEYAGTVDDEYDTNDDDAVVYNDDNTTSTNSVVDLNDMFDTSATFSDDDNTNIALWVS